MRLLFSPANPQQTTAGIWVVKLSASFRPFAVFQAGHHAPGDFFLGIPRVHPPDPVGAFNLDLIVDDIDPDGIVGRSFNHNAVPSGIFQLGGKAPAEVAVANHSIGYSMGPNPALRTVRSPA